MIRVRRWSDAGRRQSQVLQLVHTRILPRAQKQGSKRVQLYYEDDPFCSSCYIICFCSRSTNFQNNLRLANVMCDNWNEKERKKSPECRLYQIRSLTHKKRLRVWQNVGLAFLGHHFWPCREGGGG